MAAIVQLLLTGVFGLLAGLGGVALQARLQRQARSSDREHEKKQLLRTKAEEIFAEADLVDSRMSAGLSQAIEHAHGLGTDKPVLPFIDSNRLKALLQMYFPASEPLIVKYGMAVRKAIEESGLASDTPAEGPVVLQTLYKARLDTVRKCTAATTEFTAGVRRFMVEQVRSII